MFIYKEYDQAGLDRQYNNRGLVPDFANHLHLWEQKSDEALRSCLIYKDLPYGSGKPEVLDLYPAPRPNGKTLVFIHGGYWQSMDKSNFRFVAPAFLPHGFHVILISYPLAPSASMYEIVTSCAKSLVWIAEHIGEYGGDPESLYLAGHSAGGHLAAMMTTAKFGPRGVRLKGICALSGLYNLTPIQLCFVNDKIGMDAVTAEAFSPVHLDPLPDSRILLAAGRDESTEYHSQLEEMASAWKNKSVLIDKRLWPGLNHFSILTAFADITSDFHQKTMDWLTSNLEPLTSHLAPTSFPPSPAPPAQTGSPITFRFQ